MSTINSLLRPIFDLLQAPFAGLPVLVGIAIWSIPVSLFALWIFFYLVGGILAIRFDCLKLRKVDARNGEIEIGGDLPGDLTPACSKSGSSTTTFGRSSGPRGKSSVTWCITRDWRWFP